jgi:hypothetical protein
VQEMQDCSYGAFERQYTLHWLYPSNEMHVTLKAQLLSLRTIKSPSLMQLKEVQFGVIFTLIWNTAVRQAGAKR